MVKKDTYIELAKQAQLGDKDALERLAKVARERLRVHVYRLVLADDATEDIVQECMIEMFKILEKLKRTDRFWSWLYGIAHNKILHYRRTEWREKTMSMTDGRHRNVQEDKQEVLENLISQELKQLVHLIARNIQEQFNFRINKIYFRKMKSKWGSYSSKRNLTINTLLKYLPEKLIEYVIFHEMAHTRERKHNERFWNMIAKKFQDCQTMEKDLLVYWFLVQKILTNSNVLGVR